MTFWNNQISPDTEPMKALLKRDEFVDGTRQNDDGSVRKIPFKLYYPADQHDKKMPLLLWSHGYGGNRDGASFLSRFIASHGYIILHMTHHGTDSSLWEGKGGHPWDILRKTRISRTTTLNRFRDVPYVLNSVLDWAAQFPEIANSIDMDNIGMSGHSFGSLSTQVAAGQLFLDSEEKLASLNEDRLKAGILYSPVPVANHLLEKAVDMGETNIYESIKIPLLHMTGTDDASPIGDMPYTHRLPVYEDTGCKEKYLLVKQDADHMIYNGTRGKLDKNPNRAKHEEIIKIMSLAFWDAKLKGDEAAQDWLIGNGAQNYLGADATFEAKS